LSKKEEKKYLPLPEKKFIISKLKAIERIYTVKWA
jgi:hypothetical protein